MPEDNKNNIDFKPGLISSALLGTREYWDPTYMGKFKDPDTEDVLKDYVRKFITGGLLASAITGGAYLQREFSEKKRDKELQDKLKEKLTTKYRSIPSASEPDIYKALKKKTDKEKEASEEDSDTANLWERLTLAGPGPLYLPLALASLYGGYRAGAHFSGKAFGEARSKDLQSDIKELNKEIGHLIEKEVKRTRGIEEEDNQEKTGQEDGDETSWKDRLESAGMGTIRLIGTLSALSAMVGGSLGYLKGQSQNPDRIADEELKRLVKDRWRTQRSPQMVVPRSLTSQSLSKDKDDKSQKRVPV